MVECILQMSENNYSWGLRQPNHLKQNFCCGVVLLKCIEKTKELCLSSDQPISVGPALFVTVLVIISNFFWILIKIMLKSLVHDCPKLQILSFGRCFNLDWPS